MAALFAVQANKQDKLPTVWPTYAIIDSANILPDCLKFRSYKYQLLQYLTAQEKYVRYILNIIYISKILHLSMNTQPLLHVLAII
jgi:hypothetical protein